MRAFRTDGSYQTTKWFIFFYLPIYPISSLRITEDEQGKPSVVAVLSIDWRQVIDTYCFVAITWVGIAGGIGLVERYSPPFATWIIVALFGIPFLFLYFVRRLARQKAVINRNEHR